MFADLEQSSFQASFQDAGLSQCYSGLPGSHHGQGHRLEYETDEVNDYQEYDIQGSFRSSSPGSSHAMQCPVQGLGGTPPTPPHHSHGTNHSNLILNRSSLDGFMSAPGMRSATPATYWMESPGSYFEDTSATEQCHPSIRELWSPAPSSHDDPMTCGMPNQVMRAQMQCADGLNQHNSVSDWVEASNSTDTLPHKFAESLSGHLSNDSHHHPLQCADHPDKLFKNQSALKKHRQTAHTRPYLCIFSLYGCTSTFGSRNEWKRHVNSRHLGLDIYRCDLGDCRSPSLSPASSPNSEVSSQMRHNEFNRKDLFTQHLRRMHWPFHLAPVKMLQQSKAARQGDQQEVEAVRRWEENHQRRCHASRRDPPMLTSCGFCEVGGSSVLFQGEHGWTQRMDHVGKHLERGETTGFGDGRDRFLEQWLIDEGLITQGEQGLAAAYLGGGARTRTAHGDADAEGEAE